MELDDDIIVAILSDTLLSVDPSCGSSSSLPGYALYKAGRKVSSGEIKINIRLPLHARLLQLRSALENLVRLHKASILIYEDVPPRRYGRGNANAHASLLKAVGVVMSCSAFTYVIGLKPAEWKKYVSKTYTKGDEEDAIEMAKIIIKQARAQKKERGL